MFDQLLDLFGMGNGGAAPAQAPAAPQFSPEIQQILESAGYAPEDPGQAKRRAIAQGLAAFGERLATSQQDFLPALAGAMGGGASTYLKAREGQEDDRRKAALDVLKQAFGLDKANDRLDYLQGSLDERKRHNLVGEGQTDQKIGISQGSLDERGRHNRVTEGQGDVRLDQGQQKIDETNRYHGVLDQNADDKTAIMRKRLEDTYGNNQERIKQGWVRIQQQQETGKRDAARLKAQIEGGYYTKGQGVKGGSGPTTAQSRNQELETRAKILRLIGEKAKSLGVADPEQEWREPEAFKAGRLELEEYAKSLYSEFGYDEKGMPLPDAPQPVPQPNEAQPPAAATPPQKTVQSGGATTGMGSRSDPVTGITSKEQFDALPSGAWFINPADGKPYRKK
ncbi:MAG: hypothetical protein AB7O44_30295 [Hyphomicrobiaceae bacterium]